MDGSIKLKDIAEYVGVSVSTVSRVLNNKDRVDKEVRQRILDALDKFHYIPNEVARSLKKKSTNAIGIIVVDISNLFFSKMIRGAEQTAYNMGYYTIVCNSDAQVERENEYAQMLLSMNICGLIVDTRSAMPDIEQKYKAAGIPMVYIDNLPAWETDCSLVSINNYQTAKDLTRKLIDLGHREIAVASESTIFTSKQRNKGWEDAMAEAGIPINNKFRLKADYNGKGAYDSMAKLLQNGPIPTAVLAVNNIIAYEIIKSIRTQGLRVPQDISVICFDAEDDNGLMSPKLTGVTQPAEEMGRVAASIVLRLNGSDASCASEHVVMKVQPVEGESVKPLSVG